ncbi:MAG TPA: tetratricopeptide repeat protein [Myxococcota bacterium]|nr:tetratricopeptide repeat protein [Myxococcota bacterium]
MPNDAELAEKITALEEQLAEDPGSTLFCELTEALAEAGRNSEAVKACERGLGYNPGLPGGHLAYGKALVGLGKNEEGLQAFERACTLKRNDIDVLAEITEFLVAAGQAETAFPYLQKALDIDDTDERIVKLRDMLAEENPEDLRVETERITIDRQMLEIEDGGTNEAADDDDDMRVPTEEIKWPDWESRPPPANDAFAPHDEDMQELGEEDDEPPTVYSPNPLDGKSGANSETVDNSRPDQETIMDPSAGLRAGIDNAVGMAVDQQKAAPPTMFDPGQPRPQPWSEPRQGEEPPTMFAGSGEKQPPPTRFSPAPGVAAAPFHDVLAKAETFSYLKVFLVLIPFLVVGLALGGYVAYRHIKADKIAGLLDQATASLALDSFLGYSDARTTLAKLLDLDEHNTRGMALMALTCARLDDEFGPNIALKEKGTELLERLDKAALAPETKDVLLWTNFHLHQDKRLDGELPAQLKKYARDASLLALAGELAVRRGDAKEAEERLSASIAEDPSRVRSLYRLALIEYGSGKTGKATERLERALEINGIHVKSLLLISKIRIAGGLSLDQVKNDLEKIVELPQVTDRDRAQAHFLLARLSFGNFERSRAVAEVKTAGGLIQDDVAFEFKLARLCADFFELDEAASRARDILKKDSKNLDALLLLTGTYLRRGKAKRALAALDDLVGMKVPAARFLVLRGEALLSVGRYGDALQDLISVPAGASEKRLANALAVIAQIKNGAVDKAYHRVTSLIGEYPRFALAHHVMGLYRLAKRQDRSAETSFKKAVSLDPREFLAYNSLAGLAYGSGKKNAALEYARKALQANPFDLKSRLLAGQILLDARNASGALDSFARVVAQDASSADGFVGMAEALLASNEAEKAIKAINKGIKAGAQDAHAYHVQGKAYLALASFFKAARALNKADHLNPKNPQILADLGLAQLGTRSITRAEKSFKDSLRKARLPRAMEGLARAKLERHDYRDAAGAFEKAARYARKEKWPAKEEARLYVEGGHAWVKERKITNHLARARRLYSKAAVTVPEDPEPRYFLATAYDRDDKIVAARKTYLEVLKLKSDHPGTLFRLGLLEYDQKKDDLAKKYLELFLKTDPKGKDRRRAKQVLGKIK